MQYTQQQANDIELDADEICDGLFCIVAQSKLIEMTCFTLDNATSYRVVVSELRDDVDFICNSSHVNAETLRDKALDELFVVKSRASYSTFAVAFAAFAAAIASFNNL